MALAWTEAFASFVPAGTGWQNYDIYTNNSIPKGAVVHIVIGSVNDAAARTVGVRTDGSTKDRYIKLHESEAGGNTTCPMYVTVHSSTGLIETYCDNTTGITFYITGYWTGVTYTEVYNATGPVGEYTSSSKDEWTYADLYTDLSIPKGSVCDVFMGNLENAASFPLGVRMYGSGSPRYIDWHEAESATTEYTDVNGDSWRVMTDYKHGAIEYSSKASSARGKYYILGYFDGSVMQYDDAMASWSGCLLAVGTAGSWNNDNDLTAKIGVDGLVADIGCFHVGTTAEQNCGARINGSALNRYILQHEAEDGYITGSTLPTKTDASGIVELWCGSSTADRFEYLGYYQDYSAGTTRTWAAAGAGNASTAANWSPSGVPRIGDDIVFDNTSDANCTWDVNTPVGSVTITSGYDGTITLGAWMNIVGDTAGTGNSFSMAGGTLTGSTSYGIALFGNFSQTGGTVTTDVLAVYMCASGTTFNVVTTNRLYEFYADRSCSTSSSFTISNAFSTLSGATFTIGSGKTVTLRDGLFGNNGSLAGSGTFEFQRYASNGTLILGTASCNIKVSLDSSAAASRTLSLGAKATIGGNLEVVSNAASYTISLLHGTNYTLSVTGLTTLSTRGVMTQGTGTWTFTGGYTQSGASSTFTQGGNITCTGDFTHTAGTFTASASYTISAGGNFSSSGATFTADVANVTMTGSSKTLDVSGINLRDLTVNGTVSVSNTMQVSGNLTTGASGALTISSGKIVYMDESSLDRYTITNSGAIYGPGTLYIKLWARSPTYTFGTFTANLYLYLWASAAASRTVTLGANTTLGGTLTIESAAASYTLSLLHGTNYTLSVTGLTTLSTRGVMTQGTGTWTFTGGFTQSGASSVFTMGGNVSSGAFTQSDGTFTASSSYTWTCSDTFTRSGGTINNDAFQLTMSGSDKNMDLGGTAFTLQKLRISGNTTYTTASVSHRVGAGGLVVDSGKTFTMGSSSVLQVRCYNGYAGLSNSGTITGSGSMDFLLYDANFTITFGTATCAISVKLISTGTNSYTASLGGSATLGALTIISNHASNTITLDAAGYNISGGNVTISTRGIFLGGEGSHSFSGNWDSSVGTFTRETCLVTLTGSGKTIKMNAGTACDDGFYDLTIAGGASYTLSSNLWYWHTLTVTGTLNDGSYSRVNCGGAVSGWLKLTYSVEPPSGAGYKKVAFVSEPPTSTAWNKVKREGD